MKFSYKTCFNVLYATCVYASFLQLLEKKSCKNEESYNLYKDVNRWLVSALPGMRRRILRQTNCLCNYEQILETRLNLVLNLIAKLVKLLKLLNYYLNMCK